MSTPPSAPPPSGWEPPRQQQQQPYYAGPGGYGPQKEDNGKSTAALVLGILSVTCIPVIGSIIAIVLGIQAKNEIDRSNGRQSGRGKAIAGIVLGCLGIAVTILSIIFFVVFADQIEEWEDEYEEDYYYEPNAIAPLVLGAARVLGLGV